MNVIQGSKKNFSGIILVTFMLMTSPVFAGVEWIKLPLADGSTLDALLGVPDDAQQHPAVIYSHGTFVRRMTYEGARQDGYDIRDYVDALVEAGYIALAPVRDIHRLPGYASVGPGEVMDQTQQQWIEAIDQGIASIVAGVSFLSNHERSTGKTGLVGFSEGGLATLWSIVDGTHADAVVLMSPATIRDAGPRSLKAVKKSGRVSTINSPLFITVGEDDNRSIKKFVAKGLLKTLRENGQTFESRTDYPGDHKWFYKVRPEHWTDVRTFLDKYLK